jgi:hypothetical protein
MKKTVFWDVELCSLVDIGRLFRGAYCLHHQGGQHLPAYTAQHPKKQSSSVTNLFRNYVIRYNCTARALPT